MKKIFMFLTIILVLALAFTGCSGKKETSGNSSTESSSQSASVGSGNTAEWPNNDFTKLVEKPNAGTFLAFTGSGNDARIDMSWSEDDIKAYVNQMKTAGFVREQYEDENDFSMVSMEKGNAKITLMAQGILIRLR